MTEKETGNAQPGACVDVLPRCCSAHIEVTGNLSNDDGDVNENGKNAIDLDWPKKQHDDDVKMKRFVADFS